MPFIPHTDQERQEMLDAVGIGSLDALFTDIPENLRVRNLDLPDGLSEHEVFSQLHGLAGRNGHNLTSFLGAGAYDHVIPAAVDSLSSRGEFFTAYTPYQPEAAQGTLQAIFEFQSMICRLTGLDVTNASMYDGGTALSEAIMAAVRSTRRRTILVADNVNPLYRQLIATHTCNLDLDVIEIPVAPGTNLDRQLVEKSLNKEVAALVVQNPDFFGSVDDFSDLATTVHAAGALLISSVYPVSLGILKRPGDMGVDIATGEGQSLGLPLGFGGPYLGFFSVTQKEVRRMPGRVAGQTVDRRGNRSFVLTLQAREQHIRREKATSNICTNQALCALRATIHMTMLGPRGLRDQAELCLQKAAYARQRLASISALKIASQAPTFNEFIVKLPIDAETAVAKLLDRGIIAGLPIGRFYPGHDNCLLVTVTEKRTQADIDNLATQLEQIL